MTTRRPRVIVGCDGSVESEAALKWAVDYTRASNGGLTILSTWQWPTFQDAPINYGRYSPDDDCRSRVQRLRGTADLPADQVDSTVVRGHPAHVLVDYSKEADLVVVGSHGLGAISRLVLGSVSARVAMHAECPVAIVRSRPSHGRHGVVVGVDDSAYARRALRWAMDYADLVKEPLRVVRAAEMPLHPLSRGHQAAFGVPPTEAGRQLTSWLDDLVDKEQAERGCELKVGLRIGVLDGSPARVMVEQSEQAAVTVCGRRGSGGFQRLIIGSVASALAHHGRSTVVVTPAS